MGKVIDAEYDYVAGPMRVGDEHPTRKGWYLTEKFDRRGNPLWFKPPGPISKWIKRVALIVWCLLMALGIFAGFVLEAG